METNETPEHARLHEIEDEVNKGTIDQPLFMKLKREYDALAKRLFGDKAKPLARQKSNTFKEEEDDD